jgi:hypothetical protein
MLLQMETESKQYISFESVLPVKTYWQLIDEFDGMHNSFIFSKNEHYQNPTEAKFYPLWGAIQKPGGKDSVGDNLALISVAEILKYKAQKELKRRLKLTRVNTNLQLFGQEATFHVDGDSDSWTFLVFVCKGWSTEWGGEFVVQTGPSDYSYVPFMPNKGVLFNANLPHKGSAPNRLCPVPRTSFAATFVEE